MAGTPRDFNNDSLLVVYVHKRFGTFHRWRDEFLTASGKIFCSGFAWIVVDSHEAVYIEDIYTLRPNTPRNSNVRIRNV